MILAEIGRTARVSWLVEVSVVVSFHQPAYAGRSPSSSAFGWIAFRLRLSWKSIANVMLWQFDIGIVWRLDCKKRGNAALFLPSEIEAGH